MNDRLTIADLARRLDLSPAAVSYALNNRPGVSNETRERVQALARELHWYPSSSALALSRARTGSIGIVLSRNPEMLGSEPYYMQIISGVERVLIDADMSLTLRMVSPDSGADLSIYSRWATERRVDGVIIFDEQVNDPRPSLMEQLHLPAVLQGSKPHSSAIRVVVADDDAVAKMIVGTLAAQGHRQLTHLTGPLRFVHEQHRVDAIRTYASGSGIRTELLEGDYTLETGHTLLARQLKAGTKSTAIVCSNDLMSVGALRAVTEAGLSTSEDLSLISWDDSLLCSIAHPGITAVNRHPVEYGMRTAQALLSVIRGTDTPVDALTPSSMVIRGSTGPVPQPRSRVAT